MPPCRRAGPLEYSDGISPTNAANWRGESNRVRSPSSATTVMATSHCTPRSAWRASAMEAPRGNQLAPFSLEALEAIDWLIDGAERVLKDDRLRGRGTNDRREVPTMGRVPVGPADIVQPKAEQEALQAPLGVLEREPRGVTRPTAIADRFIVDRILVDVETDIQRRMLRRNSAFECAAPLRAPWRAMGWQPDLRGIRSRKPHRSELRVQISMRVRSPEAR